MNTRGREKGDGLIAWSETQSSWILAFARMTLKLAANPLALDSSVVPAFAG